jgi:hypothetical protein
MKRARFGLLGLIPSSWRCLEIPGSGNVLGTFCFYYQVEPDLHVTLFGKPGFASQLGMDSGAHHICGRLILRRYRRTLHPEDLVILKIAKQASHSLEVLSHQFVFRLAPQFHAALRKS